MIIYKAVNKINGKCYIGQTKKSLKKRIYVHIQGALARKNNGYFHNAIRKYGKEFFDWEILCECSSKEEMDEREMFYIKEHNTMTPNGYNMTVGGEGVWGYKHTEEARKKMSLLNKGKIVSEETRKKMSIAFTGRFVSEETRKKMSESGKKKIFTEEHLKNISKARMGEGNAMYGKHHSEEAKEKIRKSRRGKGKRFGEDNPFYGKHHSEEIKKRISDGAKNYWRKKKGWELTVE